MEDIRVLRVNTTVDENDGSSAEGTGLSLRDAVMIANSTPEDEIIELASDALYELTIAGEDNPSFNDNNAVERASVGDFDVSDTGGALTIRGLGEGATIDANQIHRIFQVVNESGNSSETTLTLENITLTGGVPIADGTIDSNNGGGVLVDDNATAELIDCFFSGNVGAIANYGTLTVRNCDIQENAADNGAGIFTSEGTTRIFDSIVSGNAATADDGSGGGIYHRGSGATEITNSNIANNNANGNGGGIAVQDFAGTKGSITIAGSTISGNTAGGFTSDNYVGSGGGIASSGVESLSIEDSTIENNNATDSRGGGGGVRILDDSDIVTITNSTIRNNTTNGDGGGIDSNSNNLTVTGSTISDNTANGNGGGFNIDGGELTITRSTINDNTANGSNDNADGDGGGINVTPPGSLTIRESSISGNSSTGDGGGVNTTISSAYIYDSAIDNNSAGGVGGGLVEVGLIRNTTISNNKSVGSGGGMFTLDPGIIINSTISGNETEDSGGGLWVAGGTVDSNSIYGSGAYKIAIANSTISGNKAKENGGGINITGSLLVDIPNSTYTAYYTELRAIGGEVIANNVTITNNIADSDSNGTGDGGGIYNTPSEVTGNPDPTQGERSRIVSGKLTLANSILSGNFDTPDNSGEGAIESEISGAARGNANNLVGNIEGLILEASVAPEDESLGQGSDLIGVDPRIGELQDNGGATPTHALLSGSPAIDAGDNESILQETFVDVNNDNEPSRIDFNGDGDVDDALEFDQRGEGFDRIFGGTVDIGAYEVQENEPEPEDNAPTVVTPIEDLSFTGNGEDRTIDLSDVFEDSDDDPIVVALASNSNEELVTASIDENNLVLDFAEDTSGTAEITLRATANEQTVDDTFSITVNEEETEQPPERTIELFRFRNTTFDTGTYIFVGEAERDFILEDENLSNTFDLDGVAEDGTINPAFTASTVDGDGLIPFFRLESLAVPGTFLFVSTAEYEAIFAEDSNQNDQWKKQGFADEEETEDIPEFYLRDGSADSGTEFNRFQNLQNGTFLYAAGAESDAIEDNPDLNNLFTNQGVAFKSL